MSPSVTWNRYPNRTPAGTAETAAPASKTKRPKPKSMIMLGEQTAALFENARLDTKKGTEPFYGFCSLFHNTDIKTAN